jgi:hypothetical protein
VDANVTALFLFAHQDDEFGVFAQIEQELRAGRRVCCVYVTDGAATVNPDLRDAESRAALKKLGVPDKGIIFVGRQLCIGDGRLHNHVDELFSWLNTFLNAQPKIVTCFIPAWEGGHPDHDILHAVAVELLALWNSPPLIWQYPLYNGRKCFGPFFRVMSPLPENGYIERKSISFRDRFRYIRLCLSYQSQWRSWLGLFPFVAGHYLFNGSQYLQSVSRDRLKSPPHSRPLYYEHRGFLDWPTLRSAIQKLIDQKPI